MPEWRPAVEHEARARLGRTEADAWGFAWLAGA